MSNNSNDLSYLVSSIDLKKKIKHKFKLVQYKDLFEYQNLNQLLPNSKLSILIILINTSPEGGGHWTILVRQKKLITYFDSYGKKIDQELKYISASDKNQLHENEPYLSELINNANVQVEQNTIQFQSYSPDINTCGKYVTFVANSMIKGMNLTEIQNLLQSIHKNKKESYDNIVNHFYNNYFTK